MSIRKSAVVILAMIHLSAANHTAHAVKSDITLSWKDREEVDLMRTGVSIEKLTTIFKNNPNLKVLDVRFNEIEDGEILRFIGKNKKIEKLDLIGNFLIDDELVKSFESDTSFKKLDLRDTKVGFSGLQYLLDHTKISSIKMSGCAFDKEAFFELMGWSKYGSHNVHSLILRNGNVNIKRK